MEPVKLDTTEVQVLPEGQFRVASGTHPGYCVLQLLIKGKWCPLYEWRDEKAALVDQECYNWYSCTYPKARFTTSFFMYRMIGNERHHILNSDYVVRSGHSTEATKSVTKVEDKAKLLLLIRDVFGVKLEDTDGIDRYL
jgi:N-hydroxyarylamine O-acetyltransferase